MTSRSGSRGALQISAAVLWALVASACASNAPSRSVAESGLPRIVEQAVGRYDTQRQFDAASADLKREPAAGQPYEWLDRQHAIFRWIDAPLMGERVMLLEWRRGGPDGPISRQRIWVFAQRDGAWIMDFYTLADSGTPLRSRLTDDFRELNVEQLVGYGRECSLGMTRGAAAVTFSIPPTCSIVARSGRRMLLSAQVRFEADRVLYREQGVLEGGAIAFLVPGQRDLDYVFDRVGR
jgi:hypothetical protein